MTLTAGEQFLRRKRYTRIHTPISFPERIPVLAWLVIILLFIAAFFADNVLHMTDIAHADTEIRPNDVHSLEAACAYAGLYPEKVSNLKYLTKACADNGTPIELL